EMMGSGAGMFDYDNDGDLDLYLVQGHLLGTSETLLPPLQAPLIIDRLYRNDSDASGLRFVDVTEASGIEAGAYGMGVACADIDNDGNTDLYLSNFGANQLWRNLGDGTFVEITEKSGTGDARWTVSASFLDYDRDGLLDLYAGNYVNFRFATHKPCRSSTSARDYCSPLVYRSEADSLYRNRGDGVFENVSVASGINRVFGGALGVSTADFDNDGWIDIYVANDGVPNQLWMNDGAGGFSDEAPMAGVAVNMDGRSEASMGVDAGDFDDDGDEDLFMTHLSRETNTLYVNDGSGWFEDRSVQFGLAGSSLEYTGFGTAWVDFDNDGDLDLLSVNGAVTHVQEQVDAGEALPLRQQNQLFENTGDGVFVDISANAGPAFSVAAISRGAAIGDVDNDGDVDVLVSNNNGPPNLLINSIGQNNNWIGLRLLTPDGRDDFGARAARVRGNETFSWRRARSDGSYASCNDPRVLIGLGENREQTDVIVIWSDGARELWSNLMPAKYHSLVRGAGHPHK
ncbi:MAG: CRTAC1 family protein, partial [Gammaproteobacteria bacterium]|nr:CRTAC1 family protein [Gammaproteobacteria bacterium]